MTVRCGSRTTHPPLLLTRAWTSRSCVRAATCIIGFNCVLHAYLSDGVAKADTWGAFVCA
jgi:hypothetical protein